MQIIRLGSTCLLIYSVRLHNLIAGSIISVAAPTAFNRLSAEIPVRNYTNLLEHFIFEPFTRI